MTQISRDQLYQRCLEAIMVGWKSVRSAGYSASRMRARPKRLEKRAAGRTHMKALSHDGESFERSSSNRLTRRDVIATAALGAIAVPRMAFAAAPRGQLTFALHVSLAPPWFDPAET